MKKTKTDKPRRSLYPSSTISIHLTQQPTQASQNLWLRCYFMPHDLTWSEPRSFFLYFQPVYGSTREAHLRSSVPGCLRANLQGLLRLLSQGSSQRRLRLVPLCASQSPHEANDAVGRSQLDVLFFPIKKASQMTGSIPIKSRSLCASKDGLPPSKRHLSHMASAGPGINGIHFKKPDRNSFLPIKPQSLHCQGQPHTCKKHSLLCPLLQNVICPDLQAL